jgi:hypothetical protein
MLTTVVRRTLAISCLFNFVAAYAMAFPASNLGALFELPTEVPRLYAFLFAYVVVLFGIAYGWLSYQHTINRPLLLLSSVGKVGIFLLTAGLSLTGDISVMPSVLAFGDFVFGAIWLSWLASSRSGES